MTAAPCTRDGWTAADDAELEVLVDALVDEYFEHRPTCPEPVCPHLGAAIEAVLAWRRRRLLLSRAAHLRALEDLGSWKGAA